MSGSRLRILTSGVISPPAQGTFPAKLLTVHAGLSNLLQEYEPEVVAIEDLFYARNARSASKLAHVRGVAMLAAAEAGMPVAEYLPTQVKQAVVGYGRAEKQQVRDMVMLLLGLKTPPEKLDTSDALAVAICHAHSVGTMETQVALRPDQSVSRSWRRYRPDRVKQ
jgi:crossover junction endodeoxyribonuclease RuvC